MAEELIDWETIEDMPSEELIDWVNNLTDEVIDLKKALKIADKLIEELSKDEV